MITLHSEDPVEADDALIESILDGSVGEDASDPVVAGLAAVHRSLSPEGHPSALPRGASARTKAASGRRKSARSVAVLVGAGLLVASGVGQAVAGNPAAPLVFVVNTGVSIGQHLVAPGPDETGSAASDSMLSPPVSPGTDRDGTAGDGPETDAGPGAPRSAGPPSSDDRTDRGARHSSPGTGASRGDAPRASGSSEGDVVAEESESRTGSRSSDGPRAHKPEVTSQAPDEGPQQQTDRSKTTSPEPSESSPSSRPVRSPQPEPEQTSQPASEGTSQTSDGGVEAGGPKAGIPVTAGSSRVDPIDQSGDEDGTSDAGESPGFGSAAPNGEQGYPAGSSRLDPPGSSPAPPSADGEGAAEDQDPDPQGSAPGTADEQPPEPQGSEPGTAADADEPSHHGEEPSETGPVPDEGSGGETP